MEDRTFLKLCQIEDRKILNGGNIKLIAIVSMVSDHIYRVLALPSEWVFLIYIGRLAFPLFCFLLVEGFLHSRNLKKYAFNLGLFALISEIPFDFALKGAQKIQLSQFWTNTNVFYTLFIGILVLMGIKKCKERILPTMIILFCGCMLAKLLQTDYGANGVLLIGLLYLAREKLLLQATSIFTVFVFLFSDYLRLAVFSVIPILLYNGERGKIRLKYFFYWFYPVHLAVLYFLSLLI